MKAINKTSKRTMEKIIRLLGTEQSIKLDKSHGIFTPLSVERLGSDYFSRNGFVDYISLCHYGEQNGDLMRDPEVVFGIGCDGEYYPLTYRNDYTGTNNENSNDTVFANMWLKNIKYQQDL